jgi:hypothetical protein
VAISGPTAEDPAVFPDAGPAGIQFAQAGTGIVTPLRLPSACLYLHFHQLLI